MAALAAPVVVLWAVAVAVAVLAMAVAVAVAVVLAAGMRPCKAAVTAWRWREPPLDLVGPLPPPRAASVGLALVAKAAAAEALVRPA